MVDLSALTKNPANMLMAAGGAVIVISFIAKGQQIAGIKKKHVQLAGVAALGGGVAMKYLKKNGKSSAPSAPVVPVSTAAPVLPALPPGAIPVGSAGGPMVGTGGVPGNLANVGPTVGGLTGTGMGGPILGARGRAMVATASRKANLANSNTLGTFYGIVSR